MQPVHRAVKSLTGNGSIDVGAWLKIIPVINLVTLTFSVKQTKRMQGNLNLNSIQAQSLFKYISVVQIWSETCFSLPQEYYNRPLYIQILLDRYGHFCQFFFFSFLRHSIVHSGIKFYSQPLECWDYSIVSPFLERERDHMYSSSLLLQSRTEINRPCVDMSFLIIQMPRFLESRHK